MIQSPTKCQTCIYAYCQCFDAANDNYPGPRVVVPYGHEVSLPELVQATSQALEERNIPRRRIYNYVADVIGAFEKRGGKLVFRNGAEYDLGRLPDYDIAFGDDEDASWVRDYLEYAHRLPEHSRLVTFYRTRLIGTTLLIDRPDIADKYDLSWGRHAA